MADTQDNLDRTEAEDRSNRQQPDVRQRAIDAYGNARQKTTDGIDEAPLIALAGGFAVGALIAALLPKTRTESDLVRPMSKRLQDNARDAAQAARDAGSSRLRELGLTPDAGRDVMRRVFDGLGDAARASGQAAVSRVKGEE